MSEVDWKEAGRRLPALVPGIVEKLQGPLGEEAWLANKSALAVLTALRSGGSK